MQHLLKQRLVPAVFILLGVTGCTTVPHGRQHPTVTATIPLSAPTSAGELAYLGLPADTTSFSIADIRSEALIIDCFDMYCHACQSGARRVHELYELVQERRLAGRIRFVGLGVGNTPMEASLFKRKFEVPFPVFPDRSNELARQFGPVRLPALIVLRRATEGWQVMHHHSGIPSDPAGFLDHVIEDLEAARSELSDSQPPTAVSDCTTELCPLPVVAEDPSGPHSL